MLTKDDLKEIAKLLQPLDQKIIKVEEKITDLEIQLDEKTSDLSMSIFHLKADFAREIQQVERTLHKMHDNQETKIKHFDQTFQNLRQRVEKIEDSLNFSQ